MSQNQTGAITRLDSPNQFYVRGQMCYDTHCRELEIPWVHEFDVMQERQLGDIVILSQRFGKMPPGLYVRPELKQWRLALDYDDVCQLLLTGNSVRAVVWAEHTEAITGENMMLFKNTVEQKTDKTIRPSKFDVWVVVGIEGTSDLSIVAGENVTITGGHNGVPATISVATATTTTAGVTKLVDSTMYESDSDTACATPAYVKAAIDDLMQQFMGTLDVFDTMPFDSVNDTFDPEDTQLPPEDRLDTFQ